MSWGPGVLLRASHDGGEVATGGDLWGAWQGDGGSSARGGSGGEVRRDAWSGSASRRWPGWPSTAATALNSGGVEQSRQAGWRKGKRDQFAISEISGTLL